MGIVDGYARDAMIAIFLMILFYAINAKKASAADRSPSQNQHSTIKNAQSFANQFRGASLVAPRFRQRRYPVQEQRKGADKW